VAAKTAKSDGQASFSGSRTSKMATPSRYLEAPRRLRAFVRAHETSLVVLAAMIGTIGGLVVLAMSVAVAALHALLFNISITERLSSQPSIETLRAVLVPSLGGLLLGVALLLLLRWRPAHGPAVSGRRSALKRDIPSLRAGLPLRSAVDFTCAAPINASWSAAERPLRSRARSARRSPVPSMRSNW
jgi:hypothetical protein